MLNNCLKAEEAFEKAWNNANYTAIKLNNVDVNQVLKHYAAQPSINFTRTMLWDMEIKKAWNPELYISYVIKAGSAKSWNKHHCSKPDGEIFCRASSQKKWLEPNAYETVYEEVYVNQEKQLITFLGVLELPGVQKIFPTQPLFHVQHGVAGSESHPENTWRVVHLTDHKDNALLELFHKMNDPTKLPGFITAYIEHDLNIHISKK